MTTECDAEVGEDKGRPKVRLSTRLVHSIRVLLLFAAFVLVILPSCLKMYETSHWFREYGDPSAYDVAKDFFKSEFLPFAVKVDNSKVLMRIYFFIVPYIASGCCLILVHMLPKHPYTPRGGRSR